MESNAMRKITISLPQDLVEFADNRARQADSSRSQIIGQALADARARSERLLAYEGYRFYAGESLEFAQASAQAVAEATEPYGAGENDDAGKSW